MSKQSNHFLIGSKPSGFKVVEAWKIYSCKTHIRISSGRLEAITMKYQITPDLEIDNGFMRDFLDANFGLDAKYEVSYFRRDGGPFPYISRIVLDIYKNKIDANTLTSEN